MSLAPMAFGSALLLYPVFALSTAGRLGPAGFVVLGAGCAVVLGGLLGLAGRLSPSRLSGFVLLNMVLLGLFGWSLTASLPVVVEVRGSRLVGRVAGTSSEVDVGSLPGSQTGFYLADYHSSRTYQPAGGGIAGGIGDAVKGGYPAQAWGDIAFRSGGKREPLSSQRLLSSAPLVRGSWYISELGELASSNAGLLALDLPAREGLSVSGNMKRPSVTGGIAVGVDPSGNGYVFLVDQERERLSWNRLQEGRVSAEPLASTYYRQGFIGGLQAVMGDLGLIYIYGLALVVATVAVFLALRKAISKVTGNRDADTSAAPEDTHGMALSQRRWHVAAIPALFLASAGLNAYVALRLLEKIPHVQDEVAYLFQAKTFALRTFYVPATASPEFFQNPFILTYGDKWFSKYPPGHALVLVWGVLIGQPWIVGPIIGAMSLVVIYLVGREIWGRGTGVLAAALGLLSPFLIFMSASYLAHPSAMLFIALFVLFYVKSVKHGNWYWGIAAGLCLGMAFITRQLTAIGAVAPFVVFSLLEMRRDWRRMLSGSAFIIAGFMPVFLFLLYYNHAITGSAFLFPHSLVGSYDSIGFGPGIGGVPEGHTLAQAMWNTQRNLEELMVHLFGWPYYLTLAFIPLPFVLKRANRWDYLILGGLAGVIVAYVFWWAVALIFGPRYWYETMPFLLLLTARGVQSLALFLQDTPAKLWSGEGRRGSWMASAGLVCCMVGVLIYFNLSQYLPSQFDKYYRYNDIDGRPVAAVEAAGIHNALVFYRPPAAIANRGYGPIFSLNSPLLDNDIIYARDLGEEKDRILMSQFPNRQPYLLDGAVLVRLDPAG